jgi:hypothetical protein
MPFDTQHITSTIHILNICKYPVFYFRKANSNYCQTSKVPYRLIATK